MANLLKSLLVFVILYVLTTAFVWWVGNGAVDFDLSLNQSGDIVLIGWAVLWFKEKTEVTVAYFSEKENIDKRH